MAGCGGGSDPVESAGAPTPEVSPSSATADGGAIPTRQELADALLAPADLGDGWNRFPPEDTDLPVSFCSEADRPVYEDWDVYVGMYYRGSVPENRSPMVNQWQMAGEPNEMQDMYDALATAIETCVPRWANAAPRRPRRRTPERPPHVWCRLPALCQTGCPANNAKEATFDRGRCLRPGSD